MNTPSSQAELKMKSQRKVWNGRLAANAKRVWNVEREQIPNTITHDIVGVRKENAGPPRLARRPK